MTFILGGDPDAALNCNCCPKDHHHGHAANETGTPCRPLVITAVPGTAVLQATGTGPAIGGN
jgi:hypothetical protein